MKIGVISDTHDYFDPVLPEIFANVEHILHAGDVGKPIIILELENIAPVTVVMGNNDNAAMGWRETECIELAGIRFMVHHIIYPGSLSDTTERQMKRHKPDVVVYGHTHAAHEQVLDGVRYFNPGYAGKPRFKQKRSVAILDCNDGQCESRIIELG